MEGAGNRFLDGSRGRSSSIETGVRPMPINLRSVTPLSRLAE